MSENDTEDIAVITSVNADTDDLSLEATVTKVSKRKKSSKKKIMIFNSNNKGAENE